MLPTKLLSSKDLRGLSPKLRTRPSKWEMTPFQNYSMISTNSKPCPTKASPSKCLLPTSTWTSLNKNFRSLLTRSLKPTQMFKTCSNSGQWCNRWWASSSKTPKLPTSSSNWELCSSTCNSWCKWCRAWCWMGSHLNSSSKCLLSNNSSRKSQTPRTTCFLIYLNLPLSSLPKTLARLKVGTLLIPLTRMAPNRKWIAFPRPSSNRPTNRAVTQTTPLTCLIDD